MNQHQRNLFAKIKQHSSLETEHGTNRHTLAQELELLGYISVRARSNRTSIWRLTVKGSALEFTP